MKNSLGSIQEVRVPPRLEEESPTVRTQIVSSQSLIDKIDDWRRRQPKIPSKSEAIRILVEKGLAEAGR